jgi:hypothetical protein
LVAPALGTPASATLTNATGLPVAGVSGVAASSLIGNAGTVSGVAGAITIGTGLSLSTAGTLSASGGTGTVTSVSLSGGTTGLTVTGSPITAAGTITLGGTLAAANGGTGVTTSTGSGSVVLGDGPTLSSPTIGTILNTGTLTLPTTTDTLVGQGGTVTLSNKRITPRVGAVTATGTITPTGDTVDQYNIVATGALAIAAPSGTPTDGQKLMLRIKNNGTVTSQGITWATGAGAYRAIGATLPTATPSSATTGVQYVGCLYNSSDGFWDVLAVGTL